MTKTPHDYTSITPHIIFDNTKEAIKFYEKALDAEVKMIMPMPDGKTMHAEIQIGNARLMMSDPIPQENGKVIKSAKKLHNSPISFYLYVDDADSVFTQAKASGMLQTKAIEDMFWGDRIGKLLDPFNIEWTIAEHLHNVTPEAIEKGMKRMFSSC